MVWTARRNKLIHGHGIKLLAYADDVILLKIESQNEFKSLFSLLEDLSSK